MQPLFVLTLLICITLSASLPAVCHGGDAEARPAAAPLSPAGVADQTGKFIAVVNDKGELTGLDAVGGKVLWSCPGPLEPVICIGERLVAFSFSQDRPDIYTLFALDPATGKRLRESDPIKLPNVANREEGEIVTLWVKAEASADAPAGKVMLRSVVTGVRKGGGSRSTHRGGLFDVQTGRYEAADFNDFPTPADPALPMVRLGENKLQVIETADGETRTKRVLRATDAGTGKVVWEHTLSGTSGPLKPTDPVRLAYGVIADPEGIRGFVGRAAGLLQAFDLATGKTAWESKDAQKPLMVIGDALLAVGPSGTGMRIIWLDVKTGKKLRESDPLKSLDPAPAAAVFEAHARLNTDGTLALYWTIFPPTQFEQPGLFEARTDHGAAKVALDTGRVTDEKRHPGPLPVPTPADLYADPPRPYESIHGLRLNLVSTEERGPKQKTIRYILRAEDPVGKLVWERELESVTDNAPPRNAGEK